VDSFLIAILVWLVAASFAFMFGAEFWVAFGFGVIVGLVAGVADFLKVFGS